MIEVKFVWSFHTITYTKAILWDLISDEYVVSIVDAETGVLLFYRDAETGEKYFDAIYFGDKIAI